MGNNYVWKFNDDWSGYPVYDGSSVCVEVSLARPSCELIKGANLYVSGLPKSMTQRELEAMFVSCGNIITSRILCDSQTG